jgi:hypothetical protein
MDRPKKVALAASASASRASAATAAASRGPPPSASSAKKRKREEEDLNEAPRAQGNKRKRDDDADVDATRKRARGEFAQQRESAITGRALTENEQVALACGREILHANTEFVDWDIGDYKKDARLMVVLGKRNTGKTVFTVNYCYHNRALYPYVFVITKTKFNGFWQQFVPEACVVESFDPMMLAQIFEAQKVRTKIRGVNSRVLVIFDDMAADTALRYSQELQFIAYNGRHYNMDCIFITQDVVKANTAMRRNADVFVLLTVTGRQTIDVLYDEYASIDFINKAHFRQCILRNTENYGEFIIDNTDANARGVDRFAKYRGKPTEDLPKFILGCPASWGVGSVEERTKKRDEQMQVYLRPLQYAASYMKRLKNEHRTRIAQEEVAGRTRFHDLMKQHTTRSVFSDIASSKQASDFQWRGTNAAK